MEDKFNDFEAEIDDMKVDLEYFEQEKEKVRANIDKIDIIPKFSK